MKLLVIAAAPLVFAAVLGLCEDDGSPKPTPTEDAPRLAEADAIGIVSNDCGDATIAATIRRDATATYRGNGLWDVRIVRGDIDDRWALDETTGQAIPLGVNAHQAGCDREP